MELIIASKGNKYTVQDKAHSRLVYTIKKKGFSAGRFVLLDASSYQLYSLIQAEEDRKPRFVISHNENAIIHITCKSLFLDPSLSIEGRDISGHQISYCLASKDHKNFDVLKDGLKVGSLTTNVSMSNELQYDLIIDDKVFDDYVPLFAVTVDLTFGDMNKK